MKRRNPITKTIALLTAILITVLTAVIPTAAVTVEKDGKQYTFVSHTPTTGDCRVLMIRVGFADYPLDDAVYPAASEETLLSYFDGSEGSVNAFYETASYGKLRLSCDEVFNYTAPYDRSECNGAALPQEALTALEDEIDFDGYDSDNDGWLDYVALVYSGPSEGWGSLWWPHVSNAQNTEVGGKKVDQYTLISGRQSVFSHEFGHILGAPDYYSYFDDQPNALMTYDMMDNNTGDHNGFTKWFYGWLDDDDIAYVDKSSGETTVTLAPIETPLGDGKKIAVVAPEIDRAKGFMSEYFIVEYDSGTGNNAEAFEQYSCSPGFRIFHVRAEANFDDENDEAGFLNNNDVMRDNLIHNVKTELLTPDEWETEDNYFREGDALTPNGYPNTGFAVDEVYNGLFTGISFSDFVTGDNPSFKVSFTDDEEQNKNVNFSLSCEDLDAKMNLTLTADKPAVVRNISFPDNYQYTPYLIDSEGNKLMLDIKSDNDSPYSFALSYNKPEPTVQPMTEYTLVIPEGLFRTGYNQAVPEYRTTLKTPQFLSLTVIGKIPDDADNKVHSNIFSVTDNSYGQIRVPYSGTGKCSFAEYNYNGDQIGYTEFELPPLFPTDSQSGARVNACNVYRLNDSNFALDLPLQDSSSFVKINRQGEVLSGVYHVGWDITNEYADSLYHIDYDLYKNGISKLFRTNDNKKTGQLIIDFESEPRLVETASGRIYFNLDSDSYAMMLYGKDRGLHIYDHYDQPLTTIPIKSSPHAVLKDDGKLIVVYQEFDEEAETTTFYVDTFSENYELISHRDITDTALHIDDYYYWDHAYANSAGYYLEIKDKDSGYENNIIIAYDKDWNYLGFFEFDETVRYIFSGVCGLTQQYRNLDGSICQVISRFSIGDFEIVPAEKLLGDANLDGTVDINDATTIQRYDVKMIKLSDEALTLADVDRDGEVTIIDATWLQRWLANLPVPYGIGEPVSTETDQPSEIEHKLLSSVKAYQKGYETGEWELSQTTTIEYDEHGYPVLFVLLETYEDAEPIQTNITYTFDGDVPLTRTDISEAQDLKTTVEYLNGRVYNVKEETISSGSYRKQMYQYGHGDDYFTMVLHDVYRPGNEYNPDVYMEEVDSISITTENGLFKSTTNTGMYAYWSEKQEKKWIRFNGVYTADYDSNGIVNLLTANYSSFGVRPQSKYEVIKKNGQITEIVQYAPDAEGGWEPYAKYNFEYNDTEISSARFASMINYYITNHGGNYYIFNWY